MKQISDVANEAYKLAHPSWWDSMYGAKADINSTPAIQLTKEEAANDVVLHFSGEGKRVVQLMYLTGK
jgi:hypothetical protein